MIPDSKEFHHYGKFQYGYEINTNGLTSPFHGWDEFYIEKTNNTIRSTFCNLVIDGLLLGSLRSKFVGTAYIWSEKAEVLVVLNFCPDQGSIFTSRKKPLDYLEFPLLPLRHFLRS